METKELYKEIFCVNCGKCNGNLIEVVNNDEDKSRTFRCRNKDGGEINEK